MLDIQLIRDNPNMVKDGIASKKADPQLVDNVLELDKKRRQLATEIQAIRAQRNQFFS